MKPKPRPIDEALPTPPPYHFVFIPRQDAMEKSQIKSFNLGLELSLIDGERTYNTEIVDFECIYQKFIANDITLLDTEKNKTFFIEQAKFKFFSPGAVVFVVNFDMNDFYLLMSAFERIKPDIKVLLLIDEDQFKELNLGDRAQNIDCIRHHDVVSKSMMHALELT